MKLRATGRLLKQIRQNITASPYLGLAATGSIAFALVIVGVFFLIFANVHQSINAWQENIRIVAYLKDPFSQQDIDRVAQRLSSLKGVAQVRFVSKQEAWEQLKKRLANRASLLEGLNQNPLPASYELTMTQTAENWQRVESLAKEIGGLAEVDQVEYGQAWVQRFSGFIAFFRLAAVVIAVFVLASAVFVSANTIRLTVLARREEFEIMRLVGATDAFVKTPFYAQNVVGGLLGGAVALGMLFGTYQFFVATVQKQAMVLSTFEFSFLPPFRHGGHAIGWDDVGMARLLSIAKTIAQVLILVGSILVVAQNSPWAEREPVDFKNRITDQEAKIRATQRKVVESEEAMAQLAEEEAPIIQEIEGLNLQLDRLHRRARAMRSQRDRLDQDLTATEEKRSLLAQEIQALETVAAKRLVAFYKLSRLGIVPFLFSDASFFEMQQHIHSLESILDQDAQAWETLQSKRAQLGALVERLDTQRQEQTLLLARWDKETSDMTKKRAERAVLLEKIRTEKALTQAAVLSLRRSAKQLDGAIQSLKQNLVLAKNSPVGGPFLAQKGTLPRPVQGDIVAFFGPYQQEGPYAVKGFRNGVNIGATPGATVHAVWDGQVIYSDWFKGYGNIVIIDHGSQYYTLSAQLDQVLKEAGDQVADGETVGTVGDTATHGGLGLYFEIRHQGKPLDPVSWFRN